MTRKDIAKAMLEGVRLYNGNLDTLEPRALTQAVYTFLTALSGNEIKPSAVERDSNQQDIREAIDAWLEYGKASYVPTIARVHGAINGHRGYFSPGGWAYETLKRHLEEL